MSWKQKFIEYTSQKYLGEIAREVWDYYRRKPQIDPTEESRSIPMDTYLLFIPSEISMMPPPIKEMIEKGFIGETTGSWGKGDIHFGFNISRVFSLKKK